MMVSSQVSLEAMYSTTYVENYLDCVENLPDDLQRHLSRIRELDCTYRAFLREVEQQTELLDSADVSSKRAGRIRIQQCLISAQELGDEKLQVVQQLQDLIEHRTRRLDLDFKNLDYGKEEVPVEQKDSQIPLPSSLSVSTIPTSSNNERQSKRARRTRQEAIPGNDKMDLASESNVSADHALRSTANIPLNTTNQKKNNIGTGKKKKRKTRGASAVPVIPREESPPREEDNVIDPDEPTYCLCDQISFGEMILCDNDLCPFEWFHFSCVALTTKPKGKWFCPFCRGEKPNVMKPKAHFLKELERFNKEKEDKT